MISTLVSSDGLTVCEFPRVVRQLIENILTIKLKLQQGDKPQTIADQLVFFD